MKLTARITPLVTGALVMGAMITATASGAGAEPPDGPDDIGVEQPCWVLDTCPVDPDPDPDPDPEPEPEPEPDPEPEPEPDPQTDPTPVDPPVRAEPNFTG